MPLLSVEELYECHIKPRFLSDRLRLLELSAHDLADTQEFSQKRENRTLSAMIGAAKGSFASAEEADAFIRKERDAWG